MGFLSHRTRSCTVAILTLLSLPIGPPSLSAQKTGSEVARTFRDVHGPRIIREYAELLSIPNVAQDSPGIWWNAQFIQGRLLDRGVETGSTDLRRYLESYETLIEDIDVWLLFDGPVHQSGRPKLSFEVRGVTGMEITVYRPIRGLHSGDYGNWAPVPGQMLANIPASMKGDEGTVLVEGFYDTVEPLGAAERAALERLPRYDHELERELVEAHIRKQGYHIVREEPDMETRLAHPRIAKVTGGGGVRRKGRPRRGHGHTVRRIGSFQSGHPTMSPRKRSHQINWL